MGRSKSPESIPQLKAIGLMPVKTVGNGNCLFNALSDQLHGDDSKATEYRTNVVQYMRANKNEYKPWIGLFEGGATRRNPKRKTAGSLGGRYDNVAITDEQLEAEFEKRMNEMAKGGTWGDNHEIVAFSRVYGVDINIWSEGSNRFLRVEAQNGAGKDKPTLYLVHHNYAHYSSVRNINGPLTGLPSLVKQDRTEAGEAQMKQELAAGEDWRVDTVMKALPFPHNQSANRLNVRRVLEECNGDMGLAVSMILPDSSPGSSSPSSIDRDPDSDDESEHKPNKKRDRRASRPHPLRPNYLAVPLPSNSSTIISPDPIRLAAALKKVNEKAKPFDPDETEEENWKDSQLYNDSTTSSSSSASRYSTPPAQADNADQPKQRLKLLQPKNPRAKDTDVIPISSSQSSQSNLADYEADGEGTTVKVKTEPQVISKRRIMNGNARRLMKAKANLDNDSDGPALSHTSLLARNNSMKKLDSSIEAIHI